MQAKRILLSFLLGCLLGAPAAAQFREDFDTPEALQGWAFFTGDGAATMDLRPGPGYASIVVDATRDRRNIWWALIKHDVAPALDLRLLAQPGYELRIAARLRASHAPRRVNLHLNTQKTTDFHSHLMEFDLPDTTGWHTISMTTQGFEARPGDTVNGQMALMDWGLGRYRVDVDYVTVDVVAVADAGPDAGVQVPYHPPIPDPAGFAHVVDVAHDAVVDPAYPEMNFNGWSDWSEAGPVRVLAVGGTQLPVLRWELGAYAGRRVARSGLLELTTYGVQRADTALRDFGLLRVVEVLGGDPAWRQETVTYTGLLQGGPPDDVFNTQMVVDLAVAERRGDRTYVTLSRPVLQRLLDGRTRGLALRPLGALQAAFYAREHDGGRHAARLRFDLE